MYRLLCTACNVPLVMYRLLCTACSNSYEAYIFPTLCVYVFRVILGIKDNFLTGYSLYWKCDAFY
jgi:hypothetical protein